MADAVGVTDLADDGAASIADAGMAFPADPAGVVIVLYESSLVQILTWHTRRLGGPVLH